MLKILACVLMVIDHIGAAIFPEYRILRVIGRLSMPIFAYLIAAGYQRTEEHSTTKQYALNLAVMTAMAQIPYIMVNDNHILNIGASWLLALAVLTLFKKTSVNGVLEILLIVMVTVSGIIEYNFLAIGFAVLFYYTKVKKDKPFVRYFAAFVLVVAFVKTTGLTMEANALYALPVIDFTVWLNKKYPKTDPRTPKYLWYIFYPAHLYVLGIVRMLIT